MSVAAKVAKFFTPDRVKSVLSLVAVAGLRKVVFATMTKDTKEQASGGTTVAGMGVTYPTQRYYLTGYERYMHVIVQNAINNGTLRYLGCTGQKFPSNYSPMRACYFGRTDYPGTTLNFVQAFQIITSGGASPVVPTTDQALCTAKGGTWTPYPYRIDPNSPAGYCSVGGVQTEQAQCEAQSGYRWVQDSASYYGRCMSPAEIQDYYSQAQRYQAQRQACLMGGGQWAVYGGSATGAGECMRRPDVYQPMYGLGAHPWSGPEYTKAALPISPSARAGDLISYRNGLKAQLASVQSKKKSLEGGRRSAALAKAQNEVNLVENQIASTQAAVSALKGSGDRSEYTRMNRQLAVLLRYREVLRTRIQGLTVNDQRTSKVLQSVTQQEANIQNEIARLDAEIGQTLVADRYLIA